MATSLQKQLPVLHRRPSSCTSSYQFCTSSYQPRTGDLPAAAITSLAPEVAGPAPATAFLNQWPFSCTSRHQRLPVLNQRPPSCTSRYQQPPVLHQRLPVLNQRPPSCTSDHFPAPADTSNYQSWTSDHLPTPADTTPKPATIFLHQRKPVQHQRLPIQRIPVLYQLSRPAPTSTIRPRWLFAVRFSDLRFAIIKFGLSMQHSCFVILA